MSPISPRMRRARELEALRKRLAKQQQKTQQADVSTSQIMTQQIAALTARRPSVRVKAEAVPAIGLGASVDVTVTWATPLPLAAGSTYDVDVAVAPALLGKADWTIKSKSPTGIVLTMTPVGLSVSLGQWLIATAVY
jgi:hypothetical protein